MRSCATWKTAPTGNGEPSANQEYAKIWQAADKIVYSKSLERVSSARTSIEREFDPQAIQQLKVAAARDLSVSGPTLAAQAIKLGLVDECHLFLSPVVVGGGNPALPHNGTSPTARAPTSRSSTGSRTCLWLVAM
jgi:riboflavin biosynthesis pyrimidine reductase